MIYRRAWRKKLNELGYMSVEIKHTTIIIGVYLTSSDLSCNINIIKK